jgi:hypothetical protein
MRAYEFIPESKDEELDEILPLIGAAGGVLARGAVAAGGAAMRGAAAAGRGLARGAAAAGRGLVQGAKAVGRGVVKGAGEVANAVGDVAGQAAAGVAQGMAAGGGAAKQDDNQIKAGGRVNIPKLGAVDIIAVTPTGVTLNTRTQLGFNITVDPRSLQ